MMDPRILVESFAAMTISEESHGKLPLEVYFPNNFKIQEYNATENKITNTTPLSDDVKNWLRDKANNNFVFQCLLCCQEMTFSTAFNRGNYPLNRSHLLTLKHKRRVASCVGILYVSSQKFIMCHEKDFTSGNIFNVAKKVKRKDNFIDHNMIQNKVFCRSYKMFTFDRKTRALCEMQLESDIVTFMRENVRPLFNFHCLVCNIKASAFTIVVNHLLGKKHVNKMGGNKGAIIAIKDFNIFVLCDINKLSAFLFLDHLNSYLEEIVLASEATVVIAGCHSKDGKNIPTDGGISIDVNPIKLPNGEIKDSVKITTRFHNFLTDQTEKDNISNEVACCRTKGQKNVTIYEFSAQDFDEYYMDNILFASFCDGCRIWCSRCETGIFTLPSLLSHLSSVQHTQKFRGNEQIGFMCHFCNIFFIELKGESFVHTHSSRENKNVIKRLGAIKTNAIEYNLPLNKSITKAYASLLNNVAEACKFCCLACYDMTKQKLMYLGQHEISNCHKNHVNKCLFTYCLHCNVIYIDKEINQMAMQFKFHFASHLSGSEASIHYKVFSINGDPIETLVDNSLSSFENIRTADESLRCQKLTVRFSKCFIQLIHPGINSKEFVECEKWDNKDFSKYLEIYASITGESVERFECLICDMKNVTKSEMVNHLFVSEHQKNQLYIKCHYLKLCDICNLAIFSLNFDDLQQHFCMGKTHLEIFSKKRGISTTFTLSIDQDSLTWLRSISKSRLSETINSYISAVNLTFGNRIKLIEDMKNDILRLLSPKFPNVSVTFYGSRVSGLATEKSDVDVSLNIGNKYLHVVRDLFKSENKFFKLIVCISDSNVPLIKAMHKASGITCDFNLESCEDHALISKIIKILTSVDDKVLWLLAAVRYWADNSKLRSTNMFSSHAITWLVLFYLMQPDVRLIPNVSYVIEKCGGLPNIRDKDLALEWKARGEMGKEKTKFDLLVGFFNYYSLMKFSEYKLLPSSSLVVPWNVGAPDEDRPMFMQDPLNNARNILFNATKEKSEKLTAACYLSLHMPWRFDN